MRNLLRLAIGLTAACLALVVPVSTRSAPPRAEPPIQSGRWSTECVRLRSGRSMSGLIESEDDSWIYLTEIRQSGKRTFLVIRPIARASVESVARLAPEERAKLRVRIGRFIHRARIEAGEMEAVRLRTVERDGSHFQAYAGRWFDLESSTEAEITRRMIVRIEQMFTAYRQTLPPRTEPRQKLRLRIFDSMARYRASLERRGLGMDNPAVYIEESNLVVAGSEIARFLAQRAKLDDHHLTLRRELAQLDKELPKKLAELSAKLQAQGLSRSHVTRLLLSERRSATAKIKEKRETIKRVERQTAAAFDRVTERMFARLYHEAFHAYLENYVYPHTDHDVPVWLNEGLATLFEVGVLRSGALRIDVPNRPALELLKDDIRRGRPMPLAELIAAGPDAFLVKPGNPNPDPARHYAYAWGLAYYLTFEKHLLGTPAMDAYVAPDAKNLSHTTRLERLTGEAIQALEPQWREYILTLR